MASWSARSSSPRPSSPRPPSSPRSPSPEDTSRGRSSPRLAVGKRRSVQILNYLLLNERFIPAFTVLITLAAKGFHIYGFRKAIALEVIKEHGYSFFFQDFVAIGLVHMMLAHKLESGPPVVRLVSRAIAFAFVALVNALAVIQITFFLTAGSPIHWRNVGVASDPAGRALMFSGFFTLLFVLGVTCLGAFLFQIPLNFFARIISDVLYLPIAIVSHCIRTRGRIFSCPGSRTNYTHLPSSDPEALEPRDFEFDDLESNDEKDILLSGTSSNNKNKNNNSLRHKIRDFFTSRNWRNPREWPWAWAFWLPLYAAGLAAFFASFILTMMRPTSGTMDGMRWTSFLLPFVDFANSAPNLHALKPFYNSGIGRSWDKKTALAPPIEYSWLPEDHVPPGFEDWYKKKPHYSAAHDPLKISNLDSDLLPELRNLKGVPIRHVITIVLESTRKDMFPVKKDDFTAKRFAKTWPDNTLPENVVERLRTLTPIARLLTGDYDDGFEHPEETHVGRGGVNLNDVATTSTYTLKSVTGTLCGLWPAVSDFDIEFSHHMYQPCLPQALGVLNSLHEAGSANDSFRSYPWKSAFVQSVTMDFDKQDALVAKMGYETIISKEYLRSENAKFGKVNIGDVNYFGMVEETLIPYIKDQFETAKENNERVLLSHLTSTSHHPYNMPAGEPYVKLGNGVDDLSKYVNAIGYDDRWLGKILDLLEEMGVANETLVVLAGDHGLSIPENGKLPTYYNPNRINDYVPMVFSHPLIPPITVNSSVSTLQLLPTILDLLVESGSLSEPATQAASDLVANYEGQSLIRPVKESTPSLRNWQFTIVNPGSAHIGVRDAANKEFRLVVPVIDGVEWQYSEDDHDEHTVESLEFKDLLKKVEAEYSLEAARWAEEAAFVTRWWVEENNKRWRYGPYEE